MTRFRRWVAGRVERRNAQREAVRRCAETSHVPRTVYGYRHGVWGPLHAECRRCGKGLG